MRLRLGGQSSGHFPPASPEPAPQPAEQPSHPAWQSGNTAGFLTRPTRDQQPRRRVPARATGAAELGQAGPICSEVPDEGREVREMCGWDLCGAREMLQAVHRKGPRRTLPEDLSDPGLLGAGEHGGRYRSRTATGGPAARRVDRTQPAGSARPRARLGAPLTADGRPGTPDPIPRNRTAVIRIWPDTAP